MNKFINKVFNGDARVLLPKLPDESIDSAIIDPMYGVSTNPKKFATYDWGVDPAFGDPDRWWEYHQPIYEHCRRILKPGGTLAWAMGCKFSAHFPRWFGRHRIWAFSRYKKQGRNPFGHIWIVQTKEQEPIRFPDDDSLIVMDTEHRLLKIHPCPKSVGEMSFMVKHLSQPGDIVLDVMCGLGSTLVAAEKLGRKWIGCDLSKMYCQVAMKRLAEEKAKAIYA